MEVENESNMTNKTEGDENLTLGLSTVSLNVEDDFEVNYKQYVEFLKTFNVSDFAPPEDLVTTESPFKWLQTISSEKMLKPDLELKMQDYSNQGATYSFEKFALYLMFVFESALMKDIKKSKKCFVRLTELVKKMAGDPNDHMYMKIGPAFEHICSATEAYLNVLEGESWPTENLTEILKTIKPVSEMAPEVQAGFEAIKARFYLFCCCDSKLALHHMSEASRLDPEFAAWKYWTGKILRKIRRDSKEDEIKVELICFEAAVDLERDPKHLVFLAQAYREKANYLYHFNDSKTGHNRRTTKKEVDDLYRCSLALYRECWSLIQDSPAICRRLGNGLMRLSRNYAHNSFAKRVLYKSLELSENPVTYHILGAYYHRHEKNIEKALHYYSKAASFNTFFGFAEIIRIKYINDLNYDPYEDLKAEEEAMKYSVNIDCVHCELGWYFLHFKKDLCESLEYFWKVIEKDEDSICLLKFSSYSFCVSGCINIYSLLKNEITRFEKEDGTNYDMFDKFLEKIANRTDLDDETTLASIQERVEKDLKINRNKKTNKCSSDIRPVLPVVLNYDENRKKQLEDLTKHLLTQNALMGPVGNNYQVKEVVKKEENWRAENRSAKGDDKESDDGKENYTVTKSKCVTPHNKTSSNNYNWRTECKVPELSKSKKDDDPLLM